MRELLIKNEISFTNFEDFRIKGIKFSLRYYDSLLYSKKTKYEHPTIPTILLLPNGESNIEEIADWIDYFSLKNYRVLAMELPGYL